MDDSGTIEDAAKVLAGTTFAAWPHDVSIAMGKYELHVYIAEPKKRWRGPVPHKCLGHPVILHFGVGPAQPLSA